MAVIERPNPVREEEKSPYDMVTEYWGIISILRDQAGNPHFEKEIVAQLELTADILNQIQYKPLIRITDDQREDLMRGTAKNFRRKVREYEEKFTKGIDPDEKNESMRRASLYSVGEVEILRALERYKMRGLSCS